MVQTEKYLVFSLVYKSIEFDFDIVGVDNVRWKSFFNNEDYKV